MTNPCNVIRDILPLYAEGIASADTISFVEDHLKDCAACRAELDAIKNPNDFEKDDPGPQSDTEIPLKTLRRKLKRKKATLICSTIIATIIVMCCAISAVEHFVYQEKIMVHGAVYTQKGDEIIDLPAGSTEIGYLRGISHRSIADPMGDFMATNLDGKYGGCPIYQSGADDQTIYLEDYYGFYIPFTLTN